MNDDSISRDAVLDACSQSINILDAMSRIEDLPSVTPKQEPCDDAISRQAAKEAIRKAFPDLADRVEINSVLNDLPSVNPQEPKTGRYEKHIDHTDCIWYGSDSGCPVTCSQYRDGWNDAMDYIFKNGKGYQPYRHDG